MRSFVEKDMLVLSSCYSNLFKLPATAGKVLDARSSRKRKGQLDESSFQPKKATSPSRMAALLGLGQQAHLTKEERSAKQREAARKKLQAQLNKLDKEEAEVPVLAFLRKHKFLGNEQKPM